MSRRIPLRDLPQFDEVREKNARMVKCITICAVALFIVVGIWIACISTKVHEIVLTDDAGEVIGTYVGRAANSIPNGQGEVTLTDGTLVRGRFDSGKPSGIMECTFPIGSHYKGMLSEDFRPMGKGTYTYVSGEICEAEDWVWVEDALIEDSFISYTGMGLSSGQMYGYGIRVDAEDKESYEVAEFKNAVPHGVYQLGMSGQYQLLWIFENGKCISDDKTLFIYINNESEPVQGLYENWENKTLTDGSYAGCTYYGHVIGGQIVYGLLIFPDGSEYLGLFVDGKIYAKSAEFTYHDGKKRLLENVRWVEEEQIKLTTGKCTYTGMIAGGERCGYGSQRIDQETYTGTFWDGSFYFGTNTTKDGVIYTGPFINGAAHGEGVITNADKYEFKGTFVNGVTREGVWTYSDGTTMTVTKFHNNTETDSKSIFEASHVFGEPIGCKMEGKFYFNERGTYDRFDGKVFFKDGTYASGLFIWKENVVLSNTELLPGKYTGYTLNGDAMGYGVLYYDDGGWYEGEFNRIPTGNGNQYIPDDREQQNNL